MNESLRLGTIAGVRVGVNWSVIVIFLLITSALSAGRFPTRYPDRDPIAYVVAGLVAGLVFLASLLAHEMAHAIVARRNGVEVEGITLWMFGGVARLKGEASDPGADIRIAGVGPMVSLVLAAAFGLVAAALDGIGDDSLLRGVFVWLAIINLVLAVFNLMPAAPLDGGRILRGILWWRRGDRLSASFTALRAGRTFGWILVGLGLFDFVAGAGIGGLWMAFIGWFLTSAAGAEEEHLRIRDRLRDLPVAQVMTQDPVTVPADLTVDELLDRHVFASRYSSFPVVDEEGHPAGLVTLNRIKELPPARRRELHVGEIACPVDEVPTARPDEPLAELLPRMAGCADGRALVVDDGRVVGIVSPTDIAHQLEVIDLRSARDVEHV